MLPNGIITRKLERLESRVAELRSWPLGTVEEFAANRLVVSAVERALQVCVEIVIDVAERLLAVMEVTPAETAAENLRKLEGLGVVAAAQTYVRMVQFRNLLVHRYDDVAPAILYGIAREHLGDFEEFSREVKAYTGRRP